MENNLKVLVDWLSVSSKIHSRETWLDDLGITDASWDELRGFSGYRFRLHFDGISICYGGTDDMGVLLNMSGQGCRRFETSGTGDYEGIFADVAANPESMNITRLDIACDDTDGWLPLELIAQKVRDREFVSRFESWNITESNKGLTVQHGSNSSDALIRIYDKARERGFDDGRHWVRCELQLRDALASNFAMMLLAGHPVGEIYAGVLRNYLRYVEPDNSHPSRRSTSPFWDRFLDVSEGIKLYDKPGVDYNVMNLESYVFGQAGNSIYTYIEMFGMEKFLEKLREKPKVLNPNQKHLIAKYGRKGS